MVVQIVSRVVCMFSHHSMRPLGRVEMSGAKSYVVECRRCRGSHWGPWEERLSYGSSEEWDFRGGRVRKSILGKYKTSIARVKKG